MATLLKRVVSCAIAFVAAGLVFWGGVLLSLMLWPFFWVVHISAVIVGIGSLWYFFGRATQYQVAMPMCMLFGIWLFKPIGIALKIGDNYGVVLGDNPLASLSVAPLVTSHILRNHFGGLWGIGIASVFLLAVALYAAFKKKRTGSQNL